MDDTARRPELALALGAMPAAFWLLDDEDRVRYLNEAGEHLLGRSLADVAGLPVWEAAPALAGSPFEAAYRSAVSSRRPAGFETCYPGSPGRWFDVRVWPGPHGLAVHLLDVTARRSAEVAARRAADRAALLARVGAELSGALDTGSALGRLAQLVVPTLTDSCIVTVVDREGRVRDVGSWHSDPARRELLERYATVRLAALPSTSPVARALAAGTPVTESIATVLGLMRPGPARDLLMALAPETAVVLPLTADGRTVGVLTLYLDTGRELSAADNDTAEQVAAQAAHAVARVHRQSQQAQLAEALQRSLLTDPPATEDAAVVVRYVPASEAARVGGDWYDAFPQTDDDLVVVIGDVVGHDTAAAAAMGQLRGLLRGIAHYSGAGPAEVLRGLDEAMARMHTDTLATAAVARLERCRDHPRAWRRLRWANAGHPPPIVLTAAGTAIVLGNGIGDLMLGIDATAERQESVLDVEPGSTVLLYTDGLVERRGSTLDQGMRRLVAHVRQLTELSVADLCDALLDRMVEGTPDDDVALVAVRATFCGRSHSTGGGTSVIRD